MSQDKPYKSPVVIANKKASFNYNLIETFQAGIMLSGTEVKALREGKATLNDSYCYFRKDELWVKNLHISEYKYGNHYNHEPMRVRKLLLNKREMQRLQDNVKERGLTIIPVQLYFNERGFAKLEIALAKGKKTFDKREHIKERDTKKMIDRTLKARR
jgi:SsrA-binding protein